MKAFLSISEIVKVTGKQRTTVFRWVKAGRFGKARKVGAEYQISHDAFKKWWDKNVIVQKPSKSRK